MSEQSKKQSFLGGAAILAGAVAVVKVIGALYKLPLNNILGDVGKTYFQTAYEIYNVLLTVSTAGLPLAISKLTSQAHARGRENEKRKIFRTAIWLFFALGLIGSCLMFFGAQGLADFQRNSMAAAPIRALAPAVFCVCLLACMRGYTQGQGNMGPTAVSQVLEALCKLGVGLPLAWYILKKTQEAGNAAELAAAGSDGMEKVAAGAIFGVTVGTILSMVFLILYLLRHRDSTPSDDVPRSSGYLLRRILAIGVPITLGNCAMSIITMIDPGDYKAHLLFFFENGKVARVPLSAYQTVTKRKKLTGAYSDKSPLKAVLYLPEEAEEEVVLYSTEGRALLFTTDQVPLKTTRSTQGVQVMTLKKSNTVQTARPLADTPIVNKTRYKARSLPAAGALLKAEDQGDTQLSLL